MPYFVYILKSLKNNKLYTGSTSKNPKERLQEHNCGHNKWTKANGPFVLIYYERFACSTCARIRENFLKSGIGKKFLKLLLSLQ